MKILFVLLNLCLSVFAFSCASVEEKQDAVVMSVILPFNESPELAAQMYNAMKLAVDKVNASRNRMGGKELVLKVYSDGEGIYETSKVLTEILASKTDILHIAVRAPVVFKHEDLAATEKFINYMNDYIPATLQSKNSVRIFLSGTQICEAMGGLVDKKLLEEKSELNVIALGVDDLVTRSNVAYLKFEVETPQIKFQDVYFKKGEKNFDIFAEQIQYMKADYIFVMSSGAENQDILNALKKVGFKGKVVFSARQRDILSSSNFYYVKPVFEYINNDFVRNYRQVYENKSLSFEAAYAYDSIILTAKAYNADPQNMRQFFLNKNFEGAVGSIKFDSTGDSKIKVEAISNISIE